eukprot:s689_g21.t1
MSLSVRHSLIAGCSGSVAETLKSTDHAECDVCRITLPVALIARKTESLNSHSSLSMGRFGCVPRSPWNQESWSPAGLGSPAWHVAARSENIKPQQI